MTPLLLPAPPQWRALGVPAHIRARRVYVLGDGTTIRADDEGHLDAVRQGGRPHGGAAWDPAPGRRG